MKTKPFLPQVLLNPLYLAKILVWLFFHLWSQCLVHWGIFLHIYIYIFLSTLKTSLGHTHLPPQVRRVFPLLWIFPITLDASPPMATFCLFARFASSSIHSRVWKNLRYKIATLQGITKSSISHCRSKKKSLERELRAMQALVSVSSWLFYLLITGVIVVMRKKEALKRLMSPHGPHMVMLQETMGLND